MSKEKKQENSKKNTFYKVPFSIDYACFFSVGCEVSSFVTLLDYIRNDLDLKGTKYMCREAGCGACIVNVKYPIARSYAVNSCMTSITSCHGWDITTIEEVGNRKKGYHPLQTTLAKENGSQCGYCSPAWVMSMYSLLQNNPEITMLEIEKSLSGNICRCTGYRPILEAFKKFASDAPHQMQLCDIEDLRICKNTGENCNKSNCEESDWCFLNNEDIPGNIIKIKLKDNKLWFRVNTVREIFQIFIREGTDSYMLVCGNTAKGVYPIFEYPRVLIDVSGVQDLKGYTKDQNLIVNGNTTLTEFLEILQKVANEEYFSYLLKLYDHVKKVAHVAVRNIMPRSENAHALINAGFLYKLYSPFKIVKEARIVFGALAPSFTRATSTERYLVGKKLFTDETLQAALKIMEQELVVIDNPPEPSVHYRRITALGLFYKGLLKIIPQHAVSPCYNSGAINLDDTRPVSRANQVFYTKPSEWPLNQPIPKVEALIQCAGEAFYTEDLPSFRDEVFCAFALSTVAVGDIVKIDASKALACPGVIDVYTAKDIPGLNSFSPSDTPFNSSDEEVLCSGRVEYYNQAIAIVVAESRYIADSAAKLVSATYKNVKDPLIDVKYTQDNPTRSSLSDKIDATEIGNDVTDIIKGNNSIYGQYHFVMETLSCVTKPSDEGLDVYCASQWLDGIQLMISRALKMDQNRIDVHNRRCGGAYGFKISRCIQGAVASALVVTKLNRPCRFIQSLRTNMRAVGKRLPCAMNFEAGVNKGGEIQYINHNIYEDNGYKINETFSVLGRLIYSNAYKRERWNYKVYDSTTDTAKNTWARAPCSLEHIAMAELVIEQIAYQLSLDPLDVRLANIDTEQNGDLNKMINNLISISDYKERRAFVNQYNHDNRWKKRGLRFSVLKWSHGGGVNLCINLSVYAGDGTVVLTHGGIEMGQGINTRAIQVAAHLLKIPVEKIIVKENNTVIGPNVSSTNGSITSMTATVGVRRACQELLRRLQPIRDQMNNPTWEELIKKAHTDNVDLQTHGYTRTDEDYSFPVFGVTLAEVELDVITGQFQIIRVDICQDAGQSVNPELDIGQIEGAFMMGLGYWTSEHLVYASSGENLTDRTWHYYVPLARDIPQDWRVYLRKNSYSDDIVFGAKSIGEPPICMAVVIAFALREAVVAARLDAGIPTTQWYPEGGHLCVPYSNMKRINFKVNGANYKVGGEVSSHVTLLDYIRYDLDLKGTKYMCREAGCGACIVNVKNPSGASYAVNSCMVSITSCHGWEITTIEEVGNRKKGYHPLQKTLAEGNGSQCGYCSPSWVMSMYSLLQSNPDITMLEVEKSLASNVCRCTGYRPILEALKKFAKDAPKQIQLPDLEDLQICKKNGESCNKSSCDAVDWCFLNAEDIDANEIEIKLKDNKLWFRVNTVQDIFKILRRKETDSYMLVCGNTAKGVYPIDEYPHVLIDVTGVQELKGYSVDQNLIVNANTTLTEFLDILQKVANEEFFDYLTKLYEHIKNVAHIPVRNVGSIAGNLMIKHQHNFFSSDIFLLFETIGAQVTIQNSISSKRTLTMQQFLKQDMKGYIIRNVMLPPLTNDYKLITFKIMPRSQNAHALVNAGFLYKLRSSNNTVKQARIVIGALSPSFIRASATEKYLEGKKLFTNETLQAALKIMEQELVVVDNPPNPSVDYRRRVALGLFYKGLLKLSPECAVSPYYLSGAKNLDDDRPVSRAHQVFDTKPSEWPLNEPITKVEALVQCAGEAFYTEDLPIFSDEVFCAFALSTIAVGDIVKIDTSKALAHPGVIDVYVAKDIPGVNSFTPPDSFLYSANEEVLCSGHVQYFNQPIAIVVAEERYIANKAAKLVTATYTNVQDPVLDVRRTIGNKARAIPNSEDNAKEKGDDIKLTITGENSIYGQYHFVMETLTCVIRPSEEGLDVYCASQWLESVQLMISRALKMDQNRIDVHNRRCGGAYGFKVSRCIQGAVASALAVTKLNRPCRFIQSLPINMRAVGKRLPCAMNFEAGVDNRGVIQYLDYNIYEDNGYKTNETFTKLGMDIYNNAYKKERWNYKSYDSLTDTAKNTWARAPGTMEHIAMTELVMEQISYKLSLDPLDVRLANLDSEQYGDLKDMVNDILISSDYKKRREYVTQYNVDNRWKKRGLRFALLRWSPGGGMNVYVNLSVYRGDGTVVLTHGCIEMGQGVNTRAVQVAAYLLKIPVEKIIVKENNTVIAPNASISGGSVTSINVSVGVKRACEELLRRLKPIRDKMKNPTWEELIKQAHKDNVDLQAHGFTRTDEEHKLNVFGVTLAEVELDVITGQFQIIRVDICQDAGQSVNPKIDVGQVEGAFMMGLGYWTCENLVYAPTGELLSDRTWNYYVPLARDIPQDWRVCLRKNSYSEDAIFGAKCIGEPPICMTVVIALALREAIVAARFDSGIPTTEFYQEYGPHTVERNCLLSSTKLSDFKFK
ncbi:unnamed protein product [Arctia plantaginis]|uniref:Aldehyde oxidase n=1 Tax=Arctia plantaginis TaxID=874455 RepID=A0A8S0Z4X4_ARCPL|nr:unnamed protein product [Arctia plantaginis]CAB3228202.1 unnamed protein product [Arctia plantaginis]